MRRRLGEDWVRLSCTCVAVSGPCSGLSSLGRCEKTLGEIERGEQLLERLIEANYEST